MLGALGGAAARSVSRVRVATGPAASRAGARRGMAGGHANVQYEGAEAVVRKYLPEDHHIVLANMASWVVLYGLYKLVAGGSKEEAKVEAPAAVGGSETEVPSLLDESFEEWSKVPGNLEKWEKSVEDWAKQ
mmetsp:Transcript_14881/g.28866  ORF Transcript_14881/g.28866 Transcript_14881/m.28866 type:complete len:132 (+) Transcript_14881:119-514(+)|eukprot:CAMPEP_0171501278 /NCGR_PEP_ID=MMETSP0958-20121227/9466_1 /TAXON_ID=87120 /ORGANISM="Aurantiochytrium limacinum, Strain ATCCMYA-1381" /LENGTH=131 /DNA_ID=CAMNT_0012036069 /DNA_START=101 /DNA_END=496 /DNA_ORIENTATION=-